MNKQEHGNFYAQQDQKFLTKKLHKTIGFDLVNHKNTIRKP